MKIAGRRFVVLGVLGWTLLAAASLMGMYLLNDAAFSAWMAGGPPGEHKLGWERRSQGSLALSLACFFAGAFLFRSVGRMPRPGRLAWLLGALAVLLASAPFIAREVLIDQCLDKGGRWHHEFIECEH